MRRALLYSLLTCALLIFARSDVHLETSSQIPQAKCPTVNVTCPDNMADDMQVSFKAQVNGAALNKSVTYNWTVSAGTITSGQGTSSITVDMRKAGGQTITATVELGGLAAECALSASCSSIFEHWDLNPRKFDEYSQLALKDEETRLDNFADQLDKEPGAQGYLISYAGQRARANEANARAHRARKYLIVKHHIDAGRIIAVDGGHHENWTIELWLVQAGANPPALTPTISPAEVQIIKDGPKRDRP